MTVRRKTPTLADPFRRLRAQSAALSIVVGRWGESGSGASAADRLIGLGASHVVFALDEARERILGLTSAERNPGAVEPALAAWGVAVQSLVKKGDVVVPQA